MQAPPVDRAHGALLGLALGDAIGAPFEGRYRVTSAEVDAWLDASRPLRWIDDTHMALTLARVLVADGADLDQQRLGDAFADAYAAEPWRGYGAGPPQVFAQARRGAPYVQAAAAMFGGAGSYGNGAAMRVAPAALAAGGDARRASELAARQAMVTHTHPEAVDAAVFVAGAVCELATARGTASDVSSALEPVVSRLPTGELSRRLTDALAAVRTGHVTSAAVPPGIAARESVPAAVTALAAGDSVVGVIVAAIELGGDTDTVAAMAGAMAGATLGASDIPERLLERLEAADELTELATALVTR